MIAFFVIKLLDIGPLIMLIVGLCNARWIVGLVLALIVAALNTVALYLVRASLLAGLEYQILFGTAACVLAFTIGKGIRALFGRRNSRREQDRAAGQ